MRLLSLFSGIGAFEKALENLHIPFDLVGYCENDKYAAKAYSLIHHVPEDMNLGDITKVDTSAIGSVDLITYGFPCQDISVAGKQKGFEDENGERTRSGLFFEALRIIEDTQPKFAICENVKALTGKKFTKEFQTVLDSLESAGYVNYWKILNAKDYGVPQNRERVFIVSIRKDIDKGFEFPKPIPLEKRLKDVLEGEVDEKYYLSEKAVKSLTAHKERHASKGNGFGWNPTDGDCVANTLLASASVRPSNNFIKQEPSVMQIGNCMPSKNRSNPNQGRVYDTDGLCPTISCMTGGGRQPMITEPVCAASRGRNPQNPSDRTAGIPIVQRLEINQNGTTNVLTTVQKDNYEPAVEPGTVIGSTQKNAAVNKDGVCPTLTSAMGMGGGHVPMYVEPINKKRVYGMTKG